jgi:histidyl-tRNA synthetase
VLLPASLFEKATEGTENRMFQLNKLVLVPEVTNYIRAQGAQRLGSDKIFYVAKCFRDETTTDATRLREFTQVGVEYLLDNALDARKVVRKDAIRLLRRMLPEGSWVLDDGVPRGLNLYSDPSKTFEVDAGGRQLLGGGPYEGGAGWALGLERLEASL